MSNSESIFSCEEIEVLRKAFAEMDRRILEDPDLGVLASRSMADKVAALRLKVETFLDSSKSRDETGQVPSEQIEVFLDALDNERCRMTNALRASLAREHDIEPGRTMIEYEYGQSLRTGVIVGVLDRGYRGSPTIRAVHIKANGTPGEEAKVWRNWRKTGKLWEGEELKVTPYLR